MQVRTDKFLNDIKVNSGIENLTDLIKIDCVAQRTKWMNNEDVDEDYDIDFDCAEGYETVTEKRRKEAEK
jgi:hypothetical protein